MPFRLGERSGLLCSRRKINDNEAVTMCRDIRKKIEEGMEYPGQIKVTVIREMRTIEYAK